MYITAVPNRNSPPAILLREAFRDGDQVRTRTLANLTSWAPERIDALRRALKGEFDGFTGEPQPAYTPSPARNSYPKRSVPGKSYDTTLKPAANSARSVGTFAVIRLPISRNWRQTFSS